LPGHRSGKKHGGVKPTSLPREEQRKKQRKICGAPQGRAWINVR
jgi:hypothetical protein